MCSTPWLRGETAFPVCSGELTFRKAVGKLNEFQTVFEIDAWLLQFQIQPLRRLEILTLLSISLPGCPGGTRVSWEASPGRAGCLMDPGCLQALISSVTVRFLTLNQWPLARVLFSERWQSFLSTQGLSLWYADSPWGWTRCRPQELWLPGQALTLFPNQPLALGLAT